MRRPNLASAGLAATALAIVARGLWLRGRLRSLAVLPQGGEAGDERSVGKILTSDAAYILRDYVVSHPGSIGKTITLPIAVSDPFDQLYKGVIPKEVAALTWSQVRYFERLQNRGVVVEDGGQISIKLDVYVNPAEVEAGPPPAGDFADEIETIVTALNGAVR